MAGAPPILALQGPGLVEDAHVSTVAGGRKAGYSEPCVGSDTFCLEMTPLHMLTFLFSSFSLCGGPSLAAWLQLI